MADTESPDYHLKDIEGGAGCTEIWEKMSEIREYRKEQKDSE
jgi:hypothetical protein